MRVVVVGALWTGMQRGCVRRGTRQVDIPVDYSASVATFRCQGRAVGPARRPLRMPRHVVARVEQRVGQRMRLVSLEDVRLEVSRSAVACATDAGPPGVEESLTVDDTVFRSFP